ncbi:SDR family oxidoreductase [Listeria costaricensis]|uniref:SDR family oxidoreductase n=1 Tax=Listeria costaricensis TaxID=2026604 RepID=UPI000C0691E7|nr:SDR family oxidoreductase [Listeria costaricensis]
MNVLVIGANGQIGRQIVQKLALEKGYFVRAMIRDVHQTEALEELGGKPVIADLEKDFRYAYDEVDAVIFTAGSGGHTGPDKTITVDQEGAIKAIQFAKEKNVRRFVMISSIHAGEPNKGPNSLAHYLTAKGNADKALIESGLDYTIIRPVTLTDEPEVGKISSPEASGHTTIPRADVAAFATAVLPFKGSYKKIYELATGDQSIQHFLN